MTRLTRARSASGEMAGSVGVGAPPGSARPASTTASWPARQTAQLTGTTSPTTAPHETTGATSSFDDRAPPLRFRCRPLTGHLVCRSLCPLRPIPQVSDHRKHSGQRRTALVASSVGKDALFAGLPSRPTCTGPAGCCQSALVRTSFSLGPRRYCKEQFLISVTGRVSSISTAALDAGIWAPSMSWRPTDGLEAVRCGRSSGRRVHKRRPGSRVYSLEFGPSRSTSFHQEPVHHTVTTRHSES